MVDGAYFPDPCPSSSQPFPIPSLPDSSFNTRSFLAQTGIQIVIDSTIHMLQMEKVSSET